MKRLVGLALCLVALAALGHGGEDHGAPPAPVASASLPPRAVAATEDFEMVAVLADNHLWIYLDRFASNAPVAGAKVEVDGTGMSGVAKEGSAGLYVLPLAATIPPGRHPLTISVEAGETADLLSAVLDNSVAQAGEVHVHSRDEWVAWAVAAVLLSVAVALFVIRRMHRRGRA